MVKESTNKKEPSAQTAPGSGPAGEPFLTVKDVAKELNVSTSTVYDLLRDGKLEHYAITGRSRKRISREQLEKFLASVERGGQPQPQPVNPKLKHLNLDPPVKSKHFPT